MSIQVTPLGAGQDVGKSCIIVHMGGKNIMLDCGMHAGYLDEKKFPDFSYISKTGQMNDKLDLVLISHFHLDHCGALPFFTEVIGYNGPLLMTHPTKAICPILLEDYRKIMVERKGLEEFYSSDQIMSCIKKARPINLHQTVTIEEGFTVTAYYAGHVLGACMFHIQVGEYSVVYTGDYNMTPDRHLGSAWIEKLRPDVLITESTYANFIRESKRTRERAFLKSVHSVINDGGKVLIPCFALGRAQELFILIETYWERMKLQEIPIYFQAGLTLKANDYYELFVNWTNEKIKDSYGETGTNMFKFKHIKPWKKEYLDGGPMVVFATPVMLNAGSSLEIFKKICNEPKNMVFMPGFCEANTVGAKVLMGYKDIEVDRYTTLDVKLKVKLLSFTAHADEKGLMQMIKHTEPKNVILVHGQKSKMAELKQRVKNELNIECYDPSNGSTVSLFVEKDYPVQLSQQLLDEAKSNYQKELELKHKRDQDYGVDMFEDVAPTKHIPVEGMLLVKDDRPMQMISNDEVYQRPAHAGPPLGQQIQFSVRLFYDLGLLLSMIAASSSPLSPIHLLLEELHEKIKGLNLSHDITFENDKIQVLSVVIRVPDPEEVEDLNSLISDHLLLEWDIAHNNLAKRIITGIQSIISYT